MRDGLTHYSVQLVLVHPVGANGNCRRTLLTICGVTTSANLYGVKPELPTDWTVSVKRNPSASGLSDGSLMAIFCCTIRDDIDFADVHAIAAAVLAMDTHPATHPADRAKRIAIVIDGLRPPHRIGQLSPPNVETASGTEC
jgi:hypothetical protein